MKAGQDYFIDNGDAGALQLYRQRRAQKREPVVVITKDRKIFLVALDMTSTRRTVGQVQPDDLPLHVTDRGADRRHQRAMQRAMAHMLTLSPTWASAILIQNPPIV